jgi:hypothetical protein
LKASFPLPERGREEHGEEGAVSVHINHCMIGVRKALSSHLVMLSAASNHTLKDTGNICTGPEQDNIVLNEYYHDDYGQ